MQDEFANYFVLVLNYMEKWREILLQVERPLLPTWFEARLVMH